MHARGAATSARDDRANRRAERALPSRPAVRRTYARTMGYDAPRSRHGRRRRDRAPREALHRRAVLHARRADRARHEGARRPPARRPRGRPSRPRARARRAAARLLEPDRERARGAARRAGRAGRVRAAHDPRAEPRRPRRPPRADHVHDRPGDGEGLRRRALVPARGGRDPRLGAHRRRLVLRARPAARSTTAPRAARSRPTCRGSSRRCCRTSSPTTPARCARTRTACASRSRSRRTASRSSTAR